MKKLEVGNVYVLREKKTNIFFLAVSSEILFTIRDGAAHTSERSPQHKIERLVTVGFLCKTWGATSEQIDRVTKLYLDPAKYKNVGTRQRISRNASGVKFDAFTETRLRITHKISR